MTTEIPIRPNYSGTKYVDIGKDNPDLGSCQGSQASNATYERGDIQITAGVDGNIKALDGGYSPYTNTPGQKGIDN